MPVNPEPIRIERFLEKYFEVRVLYEDIAPGVMGCTAFSKTGRVTGFIISPDVEAGGQKHDERRARSTLAHEGGHGLLHPRLFMERTHGDDLFGKQPDQVSKRILCRSSDIKPACRRYDGRWWEWQANRAIAGLLLPKRLVQAAVEPFIDGAGLFHLRLVKRRDEAIDSVAETFDVNPIVARIRLEEMYPTGSQLTL